MSKKKSAKSKNRQTPVIPDKLPYTKGNDSNKGDYIQLGEGILSPKFYKK